MHQHATLIQKSICPDSVVSNSNSTVPFGDFFNTIGQTRSWGDVRLYDRSSTENGSRSAILLIHLGMEVPGSPPKNIKDLAKALTRRAMTRERPSAARRPYRSGTTRLLTLPP